MLFRSLPHKRWEDEHLVITGGEPLLGWQRAYPALLDHPKMAGLKEITFETNGTQALSNEFKEYLHNWEWHQSIKREVTFSVSAKLSCSGEPEEQRIRPDIVHSYEGYGHVYLKLVVATEEDCQEALKVVNRYRRSEEHTSELQSH